MLFRGAGLVSFMLGKLAVHVGVRKGHRVWGRTVEPYDLCMTYYGLGPLLLVARVN